MTSLPKYLREEAVRALNRAAKLTEDSFPSDARYFEQTAARIAPSKRVKKQGLPFKTTSQRKQIKRKSHREETTSIYDAVQIRAGDRCEACVADHENKLGTSAAWIGPADPAELDHWLGGNGRRRQKQSVATCWMLHRSCHRLRQAGSPSAAIWNALFEKHARMYGYKFEPHIEHTKISARPARTA